MRIEFQLLADCREVIPEITEWVMAEWSREGLSRDGIRSEFESCCNKSRAPLTVVGFSNERCIGVAGIKLREMTILRGLPHWFGGLLVMQTERKKGVGSKLLEYTTEKAFEIGIEELYLHTNMPEFYCRHGWTKEQELNYQGEQTTVMKIKTRPAEQNSVGNGGQRI